MYFAAPYTLSDEKSPTAHIYSESASRAYSTHAVHMPSSSSRILPHILWRMSHRIIRRSKIALMEHAHLVRLKCANDSVQHATIMEQDKVLFLPVVRVHQLNET